MGSEIFLSPYFLIFCATLIAAGTAIWLQSGGLDKKIEIKSLIKAYLLVGAMSALISLVDAYVPQEIAASKWKVSADNYWRAQIQSWVSEFFMLWIAGMLGIAYIGLGILAGLYKLGKATAPMLLLCTLPLSIAFAYLQNSEFRADHLWYDIQYFTVLHLLLAFAFATGLRLPWRTEKSI
jgi:hypothetical protein